jgi:hypothetical protein
MVMIAQLHVVPLEDSDEEYFQTANREYFLSMCTAF